MLGRYLFEGTWRRHILFNKLSAWLLGCKYLDTWCVGLWIFALVPQTHEKTKICLVWMPLFPVVTPNLFLLYVTGLWQMSSFKGSILHESVNKLALLIVKAAVMEFCVLSWFFCGSIAQNPLSESGKHPILHAYILMCLDREQSSYPSTDDKNARNLLWQTPPVPALVREPLIFS